MSLYRKLGAEFASERILKIDQSLIQLYSYCSFSWTVVYTYAGKKKNYCESSPLLFW